MPKKNVHHNVIPIRSGAKETAPAKLSPEQMQQEIERLNKEQKDICEMAVRCILNALDLKDHYTFGHSMRVAFFCRKLGEQLKLNPNDMYELELAALFHDIGKIGVPDAVLLKPARLTEEEFLQMKKHPEKSAEILQDFPHFHKIAQYAKHHHERYDGRGYPSGLKGEDIPLYSRIILIADTFDAMTSTRTYRKGLEYSVAFQELQDFAGSQFDKELVNKFVEAMRADEAQSEKTFTLRIINGEFSKKAA